MSPGHMVRLAAMMNHIRDGQQHNTERIKR